MKNSATYKDRTCEMCLNEMCRRVHAPAGFWRRGFRDHKQHDPDWYRRYTWSPGEELNFKKWMAALLKHRHGWRKTAIDREIGVFLLYWGWPVRESSRRRQVQGKANRKP